MDPDYDWLLTIGPDADGLELSATPVGRVPDAVVTMRVSGVTRWDVRARAPGKGAWQWLEEWPKTSGMPGAVAITLWHDSTPLGLPLQVQLAVGAPSVRAGKTP